MTHLAKVELLAIAIGAACGLDVINSHYARGFSVCIFSAYTFAFVLTVTYATPLTTFIHLTSPGLQSSEVRHACRLHYVFASVAYLTVLVFLVTRQDGIARETARYRVVVMSMINTVVYCLLAFLA